MPLTIKNWKLALVSLLLFSLFAYLGYWQLARAHAKEQLITLFKAQMTNTPLSNTTLAGASNPRFRRVQLTGFYDNQHIILLDNKTAHRQIGYEIYTLFYVKHSKQPLLIDRGFIAMPGDRQHLPVIKPVLGEQKLLGLLDTPPRYVALGAMRETESTLSPMRVEYIDLNELSELLHIAIYPYIVRLTPTELGNTVNEREFFTILPERHRGYAIQWFALAGTLLILFVVLNCKTKRRK